jgi:hypothetical protein
MTDVFISYKRRMRPRVEQIAAALEALGLEVWFDANLAAGSSFNAEISERVRTAKCVLVCWTNEAFAHGGDKNGWVVGEATIARERGVLVPVLLERADLDPPWNTLHTESLIGWSPDAPDQSAWQRVVAAIGKMVGRADLASAESAAPSTAAPASLNVSETAVVCLMSAAATALAALLFTAMPLPADMLRPALIVAAIVYSAPLAMLAHRAGVATLPRAVAVVVAFAAAAFVSIYVAGWMLSLYQPSDVNQTEFLYGAIGGFVGAILALGSFALTGIVRATPATFGRIAIAAVCLALVGGLACAAVDVSLASSVIWVAPVWQLVGAPLIAFVLKDSKARQAAPLR